MATFKTDLPVLIDGFSVSNIYGDLITDSGKLVFELVESQYDLKNRLSEEALPPVLKDIRRCESRDNYLAQNKRSSASGAFQFIKGTWNNYEGYAEAKLAPKYIQDAKALELYKTRGTQPWSQCVTKTPPRSSYTPTSGVSYGGEVLVLDSGKPQYKNCVSTVRMFRSYPQGGNAYRTPIFINSKIPVVGAVAVQSGHISIVMAIGDSYVTVKEGNFWSGFMTQRNIPKSQILGYWL